MNLLHFIVKYIPSLSHISKLSRYLFDVQLLKQNDNKDVIRNLTAIGLFTLLLGCYFYLVFVMMQNTADTTIADLTITNSFLNGTYS